MVDRGAFAERLAGRAEPDGFVPFDRWMDLALYGEEVGYYARGNAPGPSGDFYTAPEVDPVFAACVARRAERLWRERPSARRWIELGPGSGALSAAVLRALAPRARGLVEEVVLVERADALRVRAEERVAEAARPLGLAVRTARSIAEAGPTAGFVFANELLDAQPVERYRRTATGWNELGVRLRDGLCEPAERPANRAVEGLPSTPPPAIGTIVDRAPRAAALVREIADHLVAGELVVIDYGTEDSELRAAHPLGTVAAVRGHQPVDDYLADPGGVDLSSFVDFTAVRAAARAAGLVEVAYRSQAEALAAWGLETLVNERLASAPSSEAEVRLRLAVKNLVFGFPTFRVLELAVPSL